MPNVRVYGHHRSVVSGPALVHLGLGSCFMDCELCERDPRDPRGPTLLKVAEARELWHAEADALIGMWNARLDESEAEGCSIPMFAQALFSGLALPPYNRHWPEEARDRWRYVEQALDTLAARQGVLPDILAE